MPCVVRFWFIYLLCLSQVVGHVGKTPYKNLAQKSSDAYATARMEIYKTSVSSRSGDYSLEVNLNKVQPPSQGLSSSRPRERERGDPGWIREKLDSGRVPSLAIFCQDLLSTPKQDFRFAARSPRKLI